jgi:molybdopterin molybdotransferase
MDIMHDVLKLLQVKPLFWKVALKPGMPTLTAVYRKTLLICLSGNPYGAFVNTELLVRPVIAKMSRRPDLVPKREKAVLLTSYEKPGRVTRYVRAYYEDHQVRVADGSNSSGILSTLSGCNCLLEIPAGTGRLKKGEEAEVVLL